MDLMVGGLPSRNAQEEPAEHIEGNSRCLRVGGAAEPRQAGREGRREWVTSLLTRIKGCNTVRGSRRAASQPMPCFQRRLLRVQSGARRPGSDGNGGSVPEDGRRDLGGDWPRPQDLTRLASAAVSKVSPKLRWNPEDHRGPLRTTRRPQAVEIQTLIARSRAPSTG